MKTLSHSRRHKGFGLLEVILVFAITLGAAAVVFGVFLPAHQAAAADHDRTMANTVASNAFQLFAAGSSVQGPEVMMSFDQYPDQFAPGFCSIDPDTGGGDCMSALAGSPIGSIMQVNSQSAAGAMTLQAIGIRFQDLTVDQCQALLAGGTSSGGMAGVQSDSIAITQPLASETDVINFCTSSSAGAPTIDQIYLMYQPSSAPTSTPAPSPPNSGPIIPPDQLPPFPPGFIPPWEQ